MGLSWYELILIKMQNLKNKKVQILKESATEYIKMHERIILSRQGRISQKINITLLYFVPYQGFEFHMDKAFFVSLWTISYCVIHSFISQAIEAAMVSFDKKQLQKIAASWKSNVSHLLNGCKTTLGIYGARIGSKHFRFLSRLIYREIIIYSR